MPQPYLQTLDWGVKAFGDKHSRLFCLLSVTNIEDQIFFLLVKTRPKKLLVYLSLDIAHPSISL
jgi:hypothetical protein